MNDQIQIFMSSRRTVLSGEVVTFATGFEPLDSPFCSVYRATGPFEVSASRDAVMVGRAECKSAEEATAFIRAVSLAEQAREALAPYWRGGHPSQYPEKPTLCSAVSGVDSSRRAADLDKLLTQILNRRVAIEQRMFDAASGKRPMPSAEELRQWGIELGTPASGVQEPAQPTKPCTWPNCGCIMPPCPPGVGPYVPPARGVALPRADQPKGGA